MGVVYFGSFRTKQDKARRRVSSARQEKTVSPDFEKKMPYLPIFLKVVHWRWENGMIAQMLMIKPSKLCLPIHNKTRQSA